MEEFDKDLAVLLEHLNKDDLLMVTADHGNDPTYEGTDHTREYVPILAFSPSGPQGRSIGTRSTFADLGKTVADFFDVDSEIGLGTSFLPELKC
jgi:phosphopentomutase